MNVRKYKGPDRAACEARLRVMFSRALRVNPKLRAVSVAITEDVRTTPEVKLLKDGQRQLIYGRSRRRGSTFKVMWANADGRDWQHEYLHIVTGSNGIGGEPKEYARCITNKYGRAAWDGR